MSSDNPKPLMPTARAKMMVEAARLRVLACQQDEMSQGYSRQSLRPVYSGQAPYCAGLAAKMKALADQSRAQADLVEAQAGPAPEVKTDPT